MEKKAIRKNPFPIHDNSDHYVNSNPESSHQYEHWNNTCNWYISIRRIWFDEKTVSFHVTDYPHACSGQSVEKGISTLCATHIVEKRVILSHWKKDSSNQVVSKFFSENVTFTKFLRKKCEREFVKFPLWFLVFLHITLWKFYCHDFVAKIPSINFYFIL